MLKLSLIYLGFTVLLALVDAIRIRIEEGKKDNIDHTVSTTLAIVTCFASIILSCAFAECSQMPLYLSLAALFGPPICAFVRLVAYNPLLNLFRILTKINPTGRIDYVSETTTSETDNFKWWKKLGFWQQRAIAFAGWGLLIWLYYKVC